MQDEFTLRPDSDQSPITERKCIRCGQVKPVGEFYRNTPARDDKSGWRAACKVCCREQHKIRYKEDPERFRQTTRRWLARYPDGNRRAHRKMRLKKYYGMTIDEYNKMLDNQGGVCAICGCPEPRKTGKGDERRMLAVDHDHATGRIRGLLCSDCNLLLGRLKDDPIKICNFIKYLISTVDGPNPRRRNGYLREIRERE